MLNRLHITPSDDWKAACDRAAEREDNWYGLAPASQFSHEGAFAVGALLLLFISALLVGSRAFR